MCIFLRKAKFLLGKLLTALHPLFFNGKMWVIRATKPDIDHILSFWLAGDTAGLAGYK